MNNNRIRLKKDGTLWWKVKGKWKVIQDPYCIDGVQNYDNRTGNQHTGHHNEFGLIKLEKCDIHESVNFTDSKLLEKKYLKVDDSKQVRDFFLASYYLIFHVIYKHRREP